MCIHGTGKSQGQIPGQMSFFYPVPLDCHQPGPCFLKPFPRKGLGLGIYALRKGWNEKKAFKFFELEVKFSPRTQPRQSPFSR